jgi:hypothetical protein
MSVRGKDSISTPMQQKGKNKPNQPFLQQNRATKPINEV